MDYRYYAEAYHGNLDDSVFYSAVIKASAHVRRLTFGRADDYADSDDVKMATCAVCDVIAEDDKRRSRHHGMNVTSENNDGYSVSYAVEQCDGEVAEELLNRKIYKAAEVFLEPTGLMYLGV